MGQDDEKKFPKDFAPNFSSWERTETGLLHFGSGGGPKGTVNKFVDVQGDHKKISRAVATEGTVLVKNEDKVLPLETSKYTKIGIYGSDAGPSKGGPNECKDRACNSGT